MNNQEPKAGDVFSGPFALPADAEDLTRIRKPRFALLAVKLALVNSL